MPGEEIKNKLEKDLGYTDQLLTVCEVYKLWAIEGNEHVKKILSFAVGADGMVIQPDIELYRELKLRLLNGTHTLCCGLAYLSGFDTVKNAMDDEGFLQFITGLMEDEIANCIPYEVTATEVKDFISKVLDRFRNPHINHYWKTIATNYSNKIKLRCLPLLLNYYKKFDRVPELIASGFASYLAFMKPVKQNGAEFYGEFNGEFYLIEDEMNEKFYKMWQALPIDKLVREVLKNSAFWGTDLTLLPGFGKSVTEKLNSIINKGTKPSLLDIHFSR
jgi:tagaturonate reductase